MIFAGLMMCFIALMSIAAQLHNIYDALVELRRSLAAPTSPTPAQEGKT